MWGVGSWSTNSHLPRSLLDAQVKQSALGSGHLFLNLLPGQPSEISGARWFRQADYRAERPTDGADGRKPVDGGGACAGQRPEAIMRGQHLNNPVWAAAGQASDCARKGNPGCVASPSATPSLAQLTPLDSPSWRSEVSTNCTSTDHRFVGGQALVAQVQTHLASLLAAIAPPRCSRSLAGARCRSIKAQSEWGRRRCTP